MSDKWTKEDLETAAKEFNLIDFDPPIATGDTTTVEQLENDIKDIVENVLEPDDKISEKTTELLELIGLKKQETVEGTEKEEEPKEEPEKEGTPEKLKDEKTLKKVTEGKGKAVDKTQTKKERKAKGKAKKDKSKKISNKKDEFGFVIGTKSNLFVEAIKLRPMTMAEIKKEKWNKAAGTFYQDWKEIMSSGKGKCDNKIMSIVN